MADEPLSFQNTLALAHSVAGDPDQAARLQREVVIAAEKQLGDSPHDQSLLDFYRHRLRRFEQQAAEPRGR